ncbi:response regulator transcription factor [Pseudomonas fontis]|uniref:Response regulator transcription factor n=1 Tax=Pseudomonas fontis TaxID=2942633 RepID=A0ABT5NQ34_9PSED|nr:response regulator transcription factor [Pseudomonas fontis]MDD0972833.1 response regulator transcription factor [Pseudomonas fontis]MDD0990290.1 response regulator transcription factor [Pseudomonas fontis]
MTIKIMLADVYPIVLLGAKSIIEKCNHYKVVALATSPQSVFEKLTQQHCDVIVTDLINQPTYPHDGIRMIERIRRIYPDLRIVLMTENNNPIVLSSIKRKGVHGLISKYADAPELHQAITTVLKGRSYISPPLRKHLEDASPLGLAGPNNLSPKECEVLTLLDAGLSVSNIALKLARTKQTISTQKASAMRKLGVDNDADLYYRLRVSGLSYPSRTPSEY